MFIFWKINIGGVHLIEGFPNATRQQSTAIFTTTAARRETAPSAIPYTQLLLAWPTPTVPRREGIVTSPSWWWGQVQRVVLNFGDADTTRKATGAELWKKSGSR